MLCLKNSLVKIIGTEGYNAVLQCIASCGQGVTDSDYTNLTIWPLSKIGHMF